MKLLHNYRYLLLGGLVICIGLLFFAYLLQYMLGLKPCFLCLLQRYLLMGTGLVYFLAFLHRSRGVSRIAYMTIALFFCLLGLILSGRQIWIQNLPPEEVPPCTAGFDRLLAFHSYFDAVRESILSAGECAKEVFILLGLSLAEWSLLGFILLLFYTIYILLEIKKGQI